jgi:hypothetical protein
MVTDVYLLMIRVPCGPPMILAVFSDKSEVEHVAERVRESHTFEGINCEFDEDSDVFVTSRIFYDHRH